jgi:hypothetical protein
MARRQLNRLLLLGIMLNILLYKRNNVIITKITLFPE